MTIHGYWTTVPQHNLVDELKLVLLWQRAWQAMGWQTRVLNEHHARQHRFFLEYEAAISKLPSTNPAPYERACWMRWLALAQVGGGWMSDFDVMPYADIQAPAGFTGLIMLQSCSPSLVSCPAEIADALCRLFATSKYGSRPQGEGRHDHWSDMYALLDVGDELPIERHDIVKGYGDPGWEFAPAVHYSNSVMAPNGKSPRWQWIPQLRPLAL